MAKAGELGGAGAALVTSQRAVDAGAESRQMLQLIAQLQSVGGEIGAAAGEGDGVLGGPSLQHRQIQHPRSALPLKHPRRMPPHFPPASLFPGL